MTCGQRVGMLILLALGLFFAFLALTSSPLYILLAAFFLVAALYESRIGRKATQ